MLSKKILLLSLLLIPVSGCTNSPTGTSVLPSSVSPESSSSSESSKSSGGISSDSKSSITSSTEPQGGTDFNPKVTMKKLSKEEYVNKTLGGLLGQFAGFLSGYEFASWGTSMTGLPEYWFDFINGPYAGNYTYFTPSNPSIYNRLRTASESNATDGTGLNPNDMCVWSDDDYHIDILSQYTLKEKGFSAYANKETWKKYKVSDWGGGADAMMLINSKNLLAPFTGTIESGNRYGWCTEGYIEFETLGMNAPGMPNLATKLTDTFASNVGYFDCVNWGKFYASMYSFAYFYDNVHVILEKSLDALPINSYPYKTYQIALDLYQQYPNDYKTACAKMANSRRNLYRIDNIQCDPSVNGGLYILSLLYGNNDYMQTAKYSSIVGFDGDCTAASACGLMGIIKGFHPENLNEVDVKLNNRLYHDGKGIYHNDVTTTYQARILGSDYPVNQKIDDIVKMYQENFETLLIANGGSISENEYIIPTTDLIKSHAFLFENYDAEERNLSNFDCKYGSLSSHIETENENSHTGFASLKLLNSSEGEAYHTYDLVKGKTYRLTTYVKSEPASSGVKVQGMLFARSQNGEISQQTSFANVTSIMEKSLIFIAEDSKMQVGVKFAKNASVGDIIYFDDFMLEEINAPVISTPSTQKLTLATNKYLKTISRPTSVPIGKEILLCVEYRQYSGNKLFVNLISNSNSYGGFIFSNTSKDSTSGSAYVEIPYTFEKDSDFIQLSFEGSKVYIGAIVIRDSSQYMFR